MELSKELKDELHGYCTRQYKKCSNRLQSAKNKYETTGKRPKNPNGDDLIKYLSKKVDYYHDGLIKLS